MDILSTWHTRLNGYPVSDLKVLHGWTDFNDRAGAFVAENNGRFKNEVCYYQHCFVLGVGRHRRPPILPLCQ